jgi:glutamate/tyrosine decarboxylase-like PLP-dependent enzyme
VQKKFRVCERLAQKEIQMTNEFLLPSVEERSVLWSELVAQAEAYIEDVESLPVAPNLNQASLHALLDTFSFDEPDSRIDVLHRFTRELKRHQVHTSHPCYFGLFNPAPSFMGILGDCMAATLNPQLAAWSHSPLAVETERRLIQAFAGKFGLSQERADGCLTSGGAEANLTALLCALTERWPGVLDNGLQSVSARPVFYASAESHHSFLKAARAAGLGRTALRTVAVTDELQMDSIALQRSIEQDRGLGYEPFLVIGTAGTTGAGVIDPLVDLGGVARANHLWFHVDAAWGGAAVLVPQLRPALSGIETADSITFDPHKWLSVPMGAGIFLTQHCDALSKIFSVSTAYMPREGERLEVVDPYTHSLQWSRRFIGLKLFMTLATTGWDGYASILRHQSEMGDLLRERLTASGWTIVKRTMLPVVCFTPSNEAWDMAMHQRASDAVVESGRAWISTTQLDGKKPALRACITNFRTGPEHIEILLKVLSNVRDRVSASTQREGGP